MAITSVFEVEDYKEFLRERLSKREKGWGSLTRAAQAARMQRSYLSRVLRQEVHLTPEQAFRLAGHWKLGATESEYFLILVESARSGDPEHRRFLGQRLATLKREHENLSRRVRREGFGLSEKEAAYYSAWFWSALHIATSVAGLQTVPALARRFSLPEEMVFEWMQVLQSQGLVRQVGARWEYVAREIHVPASSPLVAFHHNNWRQRAVLDAQAALDAGVHFTVVQAMSGQAFARVKEKILALVEEANSIASPSASEEVYCFGIDLFRA
jgi:uncharacterized protein (TIGR02147 family)